MKACIIVGTYYSPGQTFVNRHIEHLFGGNTLVISDKINDLRSVDGRFLDRSDVTPSHLDRFKAPFQKAYCHVTQGTKRVPYGPDRARVVAFLRDNKPDVILSEFGPQGVSMAAIAQDMNIPMFCYFRGSDASSRVRHKHVQRAYRLMMPRLRGIFAVSQFLIDNMARHGVTHPRSVVIPSGVDVRRFCPEEKRPNSCLAVGRFVEKKAPLLTIKAFAEASKSHPNARLTMIGDGELLEPTRDLVAELGLDEKVDLPGALPHEDVRKILVKTEFFLQHSVTANNGNTEGLPTAIQEAMAAGCITVTTRHAGIPEAIDQGETGFMVEEHDSQAYNAAVMNAMNMSQDSKSSMAQRARHVALERFDNAKLLTKLEDEITQAVHC